MDIKEQMKDDDFVVAMFNAAQDSLPPYLKEKLVDNFIEELLKDEIESTILYNFDKYFLKTDYAIKKDLFNSYFGQDKDEVLKFIKSKDWYEDYVWRCVQAVKNAIKHIGDETVLHETYMKFGFGPGSIIETVEPYIERNAEEWAIRCQEKEKI